MRDRNSIEREGAEIEGIMLNSIDWLSRCCMIVTDLVSPQAAMKWATYVSVLTPTKIPRSKRHHLVDPPPRSFHHTLCIFPCAKPSQLFASVARWPSSARPQRRYTCVWPYLPHLSQPKQYSCFNKPINRAMRVVIISDSAF